jgi:class 3 adenylate cyclase
VFALLESIYGEFDKAARRLRVFKVETIGDCCTCSLRFDVCTLALGDAISSGLIQLVLFCLDVAVTGLPEVQEDHAVLMAGFAMETHKLMRDVCRKLEASLGPGTADLCMRTGLHSGPVRV